MIANCECGLLFRLFCSVLLCETVESAGVLVLFMACIDAHGLTETHVLDFAAVCLLVVLALRCWEMIRYFCGG